MLPVAKGLQFHYLMAYGSNGTVIKFKVKYSNQIKSCSRVYIPEEVLCTVTEKLGKKKLAGFMCNCILVHHFPTILGVIDEVIRSLKTLLSVMF